MNDITYGARGEATSGLLPHTPETVTIGGRTYQLQEEMPNYQEPDYKEPEYEEIKPRRPDFRTQSNRTWSYYEAIKKDDPNRYWSPSTQRQMERDYEALGKEFEDGDFLR